MLHTMQYIFLCKQGWPLQVRRSIYYPNNIMKLNNAQNLQGGEKINNNNQNPKAWSSRIGSDDAEQMFFYFLWTSKNDIFSNKRIVPGTVRRKFVQYWYWYQ